MTAEVHKTRGVFRRLWLWLIGTVLVLFVVCIGPWPVDGSSYVDTPYADKSFDRLQAPVPLMAGYGPLKAGVAVVDITPSPGVPLGGYAARKPKANVGVHDRVYAKALTLQAGKATVTILSAGYLLPAPALVQAVQMRSGLPRNALYFAATHTHSGPGGYSRSLLGRFALGRFDQAWFDTLTGRLAEAVSASRKQLQPVELRFFSRRLGPDVTAGLLRNALDQSAPVTTVVHMLQAWPKGAQTPLATLVSFPGHPTVLSRHNREVSGDFPGVVQRKLAARFGGVVLYAAGPVGSMKVSSPLSGREAELADVGGRVAALFERMAAAGPSERLDKGILASVVVPVLLPSPTLRISEHWRLSPLLAGLLHEGDEAPLQGLRIGDNVLIGYPADYSYELAAQLANETLPLMPWATSFDGDYIGYLVPHRRYATPNYETREANLMGPWGGDYFYVLSRRLIQALAALPGDGE